MCVQLHFKALPWCARACCSRRWSLLCQVYHTIRNKNGHQQNYTTQGCRPQHSIPHSRTSPPSQTRCRLNFCIRNLSLCGNYGKSSLQTANPFSKLGLISELFSTTTNPPDFLPWTPQNMMFANCLFEVCVETRGVGVCNKKKSDLLPSSKFGIPRGPQAVIC